MPAKKVRRHHNRNQKQFRTGELPAISELRQIALATKRADKLAKGAK